MRPFAFAAVALALAIANGQRGSHRVCGDAVASHECGGDSLVPLNVSEPDWSGSESPACLSWCERVAADSTQDDVSCCFFGDSSQRCELRVGPPVAKPSKPSRSAAVCSMQVETATSTAASFTPTEPEPPATTAAPRRVTTPTTESPQGVVEGDATTQGPDGQQASTTSDEGDATAVTTAGAADGVATDSPDADAGDDNASDEPAGTVAALLLAV